MRQRYRLVVAVAVVGVSASCGDDGRSRRTAPDAAAGADTGGSAGGAGASANTGGGGNTGGADASAGGSLITGGTTATGGGGGTGGGATGGGGGTLDTGGTSSSGGTATGGAAPGGTGTGGEATSEDGGVPVIPPSACTPAPPEGSVFYVAPGGSDETGDGSESEPWATIDHALDAIADGSTVLVEPGEYAGRVRLDAVFATGVVIRSRVPYQARLRSEGPVVTSYYGEGITLDGFDIAHSGPGAGALVVQIQNLRSDGGVTGRIVIRNNVLHDSYNNDILKINNGAQSVTVERNVFYNQAGSDEHIDINSVTNVVVQDNVFFNDFAGSGRVNGNDTSSYIVIKDSNGSTDSIAGSDQIMVRRNVFLNWEGSTGSNFLLIGEDGNDFFEASNVVVESNLFLGNSPNTLRAAFGVKGSRDVSFRWNTVVGDLPSLAFAMRLNTEGNNLPNERIHFSNNVWSDPTGTMEDFSDTPAGETASFVLDRNLYFNASAAVPEDAAELVNPSDDPNAVLGDPRLPSLSGLVVPRWESGIGEFADGSSTTCAAHRQLAERYGALGAGSAAIDRADPTTPPPDILGRARGPMPDMGAYEAGTE